MNCKIPLLLFMTSRHQFLLNAYFSSHNVSEFYSLKCTESSQKRIDLEKRSPIILSKCARVCRCIILNTIAPIKWRSQCRRNFKITAISYVEHMRHNCAINLKEPVLHSLQKTLTQKFLF